MTIATVTAGVATAIEDLEAAFPERISYVPSGDGGANVTVADVELGPNWTSPRAPLTFNVAYNYPYTPIYPYYLPSGTRPRTHSPQALQEVQWQGEQVVQLSLRHTRWDPRIDSAVGSVVQVQAWAQAQ